MYQALLTRKYLTGKIMPLLASLAVALCTAMVLISWSVMGGFLDMLLDTGSKIIGDVAISWPTAGFAHADDLIDRLEADDMIDAASPSIETIGLVSLADGRLEKVIVKGIDGPSYARVVDYADALWWKPIDEPNPNDTDRRDWRLTDHDFFAQLYTDGLALTEHDPATGEPEPAIVMGIEVSRFNIRQPGGWYLPGAPIRREADGSERLLNMFMPNESVTLRVLPLDEQGRNLDIVARVFPVANEFRTGLYEIDRGTVLVRLDALQKMLKMDEARRLDAPLDPFAVRIDPETGRQTFARPKASLIDPARVTSVLVRSAPGIEPETLRARCHEVYAAFAEAHAGQVPSADTIDISTWEDENAHFIAAVKMETALVLFIFGIISLTAVFLVLAIFWSMVSEKTKDIGVLRSLGASRRGVAWLWLRYGLVIGVLGSIVGGVLSYTIVWNINPIHEWLGHTLGLYIWDPKVYYFTTIPNSVDTVKAAMVLGGGALMSVLGALVPAVRAASMDPVRALRFE